MTLTRSCVAITHAPKMDFRQDYAALPRWYGTRAYFSRPDIQVIYRLVEDNLRALDAKTGCLKRLEGRHVLVKPNLVTVYSGMGLQERDYPETTDPRVIDALVAFLKRFTRHITILESSGRGVPTRGSFRVSGLDRLAQYHQVGLIALEEQAAVRYVLPGARVQKEIVVPEVISELVSGNAFLISVPKMKTNLYTGVSLGFKNIMGLLPYNLRQRNHHFALDQKLVDILQLFQPDLTLIDGLVGGEGNCPAPVDPVDSRVLISGTNSLETDRAAVRMMGFDPAGIPLLRLADQAGWGDPDVEILGKETVIPFRAADPSLLNEAFRSLFPNVTVLVGHDFPHAPKLKEQEAGEENLPQRMELACRGGCLASLRFAFDMFVRESQRRDFHLVVVIGAGQVVDGQPFYLDAENRRYTPQDIQKLKGKKLVVGSCARALAEIADRYVEGCMPFPNSPHAALHALTRTWCSVLSLKNRHLLPLLLDTLQTCEARKKLIRAGRRLDVPLPQDAALVEPPLLTPADAQLRAIPWPLPPLSPDEIRAACAQENRAVLATFLG
jgi:uncharacterized protein (DUF362 family)